MTLAPTDLNIEIARRVALLLDHAYFTDPVMFRVVDIIRDGADPIEALCEGLKAQTATVKSYQSEMLRLMHESTRPVFFMNKEDM